MWVVLLAVPIVVSVFSQLEFIQNAEGYFVEGLLWDIGKREVVADVIAPAWALTLIVLGFLNRRLLARYHGDPTYVPTTWLAKRFANDVWVERSTWIAMTGGVLVIITSWTREWARFGEQPDAFWYVLVIVGAIGLTLVPAWWVRGDLHAATERHLKNSRVARSINTYLFFGEDGRPRWLQAIALASLTGGVAWIVLRQLEALLTGMHSDARAAANLASISAITEVDLSRKPAAVLERVTTWKEFSDSLGDSFAGAYEIVVASLAIDTFLLIPAYVAVIGILLLWAQQSLTGSLEDRQLRTYRFITVLALGVLVVVALADVIENLMAWIVIDRAWNSPGKLTASSVRYLWFASIFKNLGLVLLVVVGVLVVALRRKRLYGLFQALVAVRGELLVMTLLGLSLLFLPQTEDVIRRWNVSVTLLTVGFATALAMLLQWTAHRTLTGLQQAQAAVENGERLEPAAVSLPGGAAPISLRRGVVLSVFVLAGLQIVLVTVLDLPAGLGFVVPTALIAIIWLFGLPLPAAAFVRGDRHISDRARHLIPRFIGATVLILVGAAVLQAAVPQLVFARHADLYLVFAALPLGLGFYRLQTRTGPTMGRLELFVTIGVLAFGVWLILVEGNPELSGVALAFTGVMLLYGSMPFFYSYESESGPSRFARTRLQFLHVQPILAVAAVGAVVTAVVLVAAPLRFAPSLGTVAIMLLGAMIFAAAATGLVSFAERTRPPDLFAAFNIRRTPVFVFLFAWLVLAAAAATGASNDIPVTTTPTGGATPGVSVQDVWERWTERVSIEPGGPGVQERRGTNSVPAVPLVLIASSGGGLRAAVWTSYVLDCLFLGGISTIEGCAVSDRESGAEEILMMSGVSGGSLGLISFAAALTEGSEAGTDWVKNRLSDDYLAPAMAWLLLVDTPRSFIGFGPRIRDRSEVMEQAWEQSFSDDGGPSFFERGIFNVWHEETRLPLLVFNGTSVNDPCRFNISVLDVNAHTPDDTCTSLSSFEGRIAGIQAGATLAATQDLVDYLCPGQDIRLSTAALLSARFPIVSPSGRVGEDLDHCAREGAAFVVDGAYLEGSGAGTVTEVWNQLESRVMSANSSRGSEVCVVPFFIQIDNGYENPNSSDANRSPREALVPLSTLLSGQFGRVANAREGAAIEFDLPLDAADGPVTVVHIPSGKEILSRYARFTTRAHPGVQAPLGWTLSDASIDDLRAQLMIEENQKELAEVANWLGGDLRCERET